MSIRAVGSVLLALMALPACDVAVESVVGAPAVASAPLTLPANAWQVDFSNPGTSAATAVDMPIDEHVIDAIDHAAATVDIAVYGFDHPGITQAVLRAHARGIAVRFVGHGDELATSDGLKALQQAGVPMSLRPTTALMHHKFIVVDGHLVGFGSFNFTTYAANQNDENFVFIESPALADIFAGEHAQMFAGKFGAKKIARAAQPTVAVEGGTVALHFSPKENTKARLRDALATAETRVYFMTFSFTLSEVAADLVALHERGVEVVGVFDKGSASSRYSQDDYLAANGVSVYLDGNENTSGFAGGRLHDKVMIVDAGGSDPLVVTGSYNWSAGASDENDETLAILRGRRFVAPYVAEFCRIYRASSAAVVQDSPPTLCVDRPLVAMTEILANPDGVDRNEELVELVNFGNVAADLSGWAIGDAVSASRHVFAEGTTLAPHAAIVVYSGPGTGRVAEAIVASSGQLAINNDSETMTLRDAADVTIDEVRLGLGLSGESLHRDDIGLADDDFDGVIDGGVWGQHGALSTAGLRTSPGLRVDGSAWLAAADEGGDPTQGPSDVDDVIVASALPNPVGADRPEEYVTIVNTGIVSVDLSGWSVGDLVSPHRHVFSTTLLAPGGTIKIYDGGVHGDGIAASSGALSLNNGDETVSLYDAHGALASTLTWRTASEGRVITRD